MMKIDLSAIDRERFSVETRTHAKLGEVVLVVPDKATVFKLRPEEEHLRSLLCRPDGTVISAGFPKFYNFGENPKHDLLTKEVFSQGKASFRMKLDGSLIIRSVVDGEVLFRTRGCHELADGFAEPVMGLIRERYPRLLDPALGSSDEYWLFEYLAPTNQIVVRYDHAHLMALGRAKFSDSGKLEVYLIPLESLVEMEMDAAPVVPQFDTVDQIQAFLALSEGEKGYVSWAQIGDDPMGPFHLSKWKTGWYLRLHALRSNASPRFVREYCVMHELTSLDAFRQKMASEGFDWEAVSYLEPAYQEAEGRIKEVILIADAVDLAIEIEGLTELPDRKAKAEAAKRLREDFKEEWVFHYAIQTLGDRRDVALDMLRARMLDVSAGEFQHLKKTWRGLKGLAPKADDS